MTTMTINVKLRIDDDLYKALKRLADAGDRSVAAEMRRGLKAHVEAAQEVSAA